MKTPRYTFRLVCSLLVVTALLWSARQLGQIEVPESSTASSHIVLASGLTMVPLALPILARMASPERQ
ncbi:MAG: hypothetical protein Q8M02_06905 [Candidatus Didemnitutus sp.]|nr:hypothetical protein [Candidatus Didemnitutus sp.]